MGFGEEVGWAAASGRIREAPSARDALGKAAWGYGAGRRGWGVGSERGGRRLPVAALRVGGVEAEGSRRTSLGASPAESEGLLTPVSRPGRAGNPMPLGAEEGKHRCNSAK